MNRIEIVGEPVVLAVPGKSDGTHRQGGTRMHPVLNGRDQGQLRVAGGVLAGDHHARLNVGVPDRVEIGDEQRPVRGRLVDGRQVLPGLEVLLRQYLGPVRGVRHRDAEHVAVEAQVPR